MVTVTDMLLAAAVTVDAHTLGDNRFDILNKNNASRALISAPQTCNRNGIGIFLPAVRTGRQGIGGSNHQPRTAL